MDPHSEVLKLRADVVVTALEREAVMLDLATKYFYSLNPSAWAITQLFEGGSTRDAAEAQAASWGADPGHGEVSTFVDRLVAEGLVVPDNESTFEVEASFSGEWTTPTVEKHKEPLQRVMVSAFDPTLPLAE